jgi:hypothetical protein
MIDPVIIPGAISRFLITGRLFAHGTTLFQIAHRLEFALPNIDNPLIR